MKITDFIDFNSLGVLNYESIIHCKLDDDHKVFVTDEKFQLPKKRKTLSFITKAKKSFVSYIKIKDKYIQGIHDEDLGPIDSMNLLIFLSTDKKFYCVNFNYTDENMSLSFMGIFGKKSGKFFAISHNFNCKESGQYLCLSNNKYTIIDYDSVTDYPLDFKIKPLNIINNLRNVYKEAYENIYEDLVELQ